MQGIFVSSKEYKEVSILSSLLREASFELEFSLRKMKVQVVLSALDDHGQLTRLHSSLPSVASLLLRSSVLRLLCHPIQIPGSPILSPVCQAQPPRHPKLAALLHEYELTTHAHGLSSNMIVGLSRPCAKRTHNGVNLSVVTKPIVLMATISNLLAMV